ncbi:MAG: RNA-binding domain-containing protein [Thermoplasmatota archaeon]
MKVSIRATIKATEVTERVHEAMTAFWPDATFDGDEQAYATDCNDFRAAIWEQQIIDSVRSQLLHGMRSEVIRFKLDKQAALQGKISFADKSPALGAVDVQIDPEMDLEAFCWWLCPETEEGKIVGPTD